MSAAGTVAVTGATGLVGAALCERLEREGRKVLRLSRSPKGEGSARFVLGERVEPSLLRGADALVHAAYDFKAFGWEEIRRANVRGSERLLEAAREAGVRRVVFVSTVSAFEGCRSLYGRGKLLVEEKVRALGGAVVRPGLVWGVPGKGMFGALAKAARLPLLPVFDGGRQPFVLVHAEDLAAALAAACGSDPRWTEGPVTAAHPEKVAFRAILEALARAQGRRARFVSAPGALGLAGLKTLETLGLRPGFRSDSLVSLLHPDPAMDFAAAERLGLRFRPFSELSKEDLSQRILPRRA